MFKHQARKIKPTRRSVSGVISYKKKPLAYESTLERDFIIYHAFREDVKNITPQPVKIPFNKNGRTYHYTPDYYVELDAKSGKSFIAEVKPKQEWQLNWRDWSDKWKAAKQYCKEKGISFIIFDEDRIRHEALDNINFLRTYETIRVTKEEVEVIRRLVLKEELHIRKVQESVPFQEVVTRRKQHVKVEKDDDR